MRFNFKKLPKLLLSQIPTVASYIIVAVAGSALLAYAATTTIGEDIATTNLTVSGNATTTGTFNVAGSTTLATTTLSGDLDMGSKEIKNVVLETLSSFPSSPTAGQMFWGTSSSSPYWYDSTSSDWKGILSTPSNDNMVTVCASGCDYTDPRASMQYLQTLNSNAGPSSSSPYAVMIFPGTYDVTPATGWGTSNPNAEIDLGAGYSAGVTTIHVDGLVDGNTITAGDYFSITSTNTYIYKITTTTASISGNESDITFTPGLIEAVADNDDIFTGGIQTSISNFSLVGQGWETTILKNTGDGSTYGRFVLDFTARSGTIAVRGLTLQRGGTSTGRNAIIYQTDRAGVSTDSSLTMIIEDNYFDGGNAGNMTAYHSPDGLNRSASGHFRMRRNIVANVNSIMLISNPKSYIVEDNYFVELLEANSSFNVKGINIYYRDAEHVTESDYEDVGVNKIINNTVIGTVESGATPYMAGITIEAILTGTGGPYDLFIDGNRIHLDNTGGASSADIYGIYNIATADFDIAFGDNQITLVNGASATDSLLIGSSVAVPAFNSIKGWPLRLLEAPLVTAAASYAMREFESAVAVAYFPSADVTVTLPYCYDYREVTIFAAVTNATYKIPIAPSGGSTINGVSGTYDPDMDTLGDIVKLQCFWGDWKVVGERIK